MNSFRKWAAVLALAAFAWPLAASAAPNSTQNTRTVLNNAGAGNVTKTLPFGVRPGDSLIVPLNVSATGSAAVSDDARDRDLVLQATPMLQTKLYLYNVATQGLGVDSSVAIPTRGWNHMALACQIQVKDSLFIKRIVFGIQVRGHFTNSSDSLSTYPMARLRKASGSAAAPNQIQVPAYPDTIGGFNFPDTLTDAGALSSELIVSMESSFNHQLAAGSPTFTRLLWIPLVDPNTGEPWAAPYTSIRIRMLKAWQAVTGAGVFGAMTANQASALVTVNLVGWR